MAPPGLPSGRERAFPRDDCQGSRGRWLLFLLLVLKGVFESTGLHPCVRSVVPEPLSEPGAVPGAEGGVNEHKAVFPPARALCFGGRAGFPGGAGLESHTEGKSPWRFKAMSQEELPEGKDG